MPFNSGTYTAPANSWNPAVGGTTVDSADWNSTQSDYETGLSTCWLKDGTQTATANFNFSGFKWTNVNTNSGSTSRSEFTSGATLQDGAPLDAGYTGGTSTAFTATLSPAISAYADKQCFRVIFNAASGATPTINFNSVGAKKIYWNNSGATTQVTTGDIPINYPAELRYDSTLDTAAGAFWWINPPTIVNGLTATTTVDYVADKLPIYDASATANRSVLPAYLLGLMRGYIFGLTLSNDGTDPTNDIAIAAGRTIDNSSQALMVLASSLIKRLDANWAAGTNQGMRYSGAAIADTTYHIWCVSTAAGTVDIYATPNASASTPSAALTLLQAETGGSSYVYIRRIGSILRESGSIVAFVQDGDLFMRSSPVLDVDVTGAGIGTSAVTRTLSVPLGINVLAHMNLYYQVNTTNESCYLSDLALTDLSPSTTAAPLGTGGNNTVGGGGVHAQVTIRTNTSAQIRSRLSAAGLNTALRIATLGWTDKRGQQS